MAIPKYKIRMVSKAEEVALLKKYHYSKKPVPNSAVRFGAFHGTRMVGVATFGRIINCVQMFKSDPGNRHGLELNRLAMVDDAPKNSESWFLMVCIRLLKKKYPWLRYVNTWADGLRCQGGTIYKACGFLYLRKNEIGAKGGKLFLLPNGEVLHQIAFDKIYLKKYYQLVKDIPGQMEKVRRIFGEGVTELKGGYQYHYMYLIDRALRGELLFGPLPYEAPSIPPAPGQSPSPPQDEHRLSTAESEAQRPYQEMRAEYPAMTGAEAGKAVSYSKDGVEVFA